MFLVVGETQPLDVLKQIAKWSNLGLSSTENIGSALKTKVVFCGLNINWGEIATVDVCDCCGIGMHYTI